MATMKYGSKTPIEPKSIRMEDNGRALEVTEVPGKRPHFVIDYDARGITDQVIINPARVLRGESFGPDGEKLRQFLDNIDSEFLDTVREHLQNENPPANQEEKGVYFAALAFLHTPTNPSDLEGTIRQVREDLRKKPPANKKHKEAHEAALSFFDKPAKQKGRKAKKGGKPA